MKFHLFYLPNEEIQSGKIQNNIFNFEYCCSGFPRFQDKRAAIFKFFLSFFTLFFYIPWFRSVLSRTIICPTTYHIVPPWEVLLKRIRKLAPLVVFLIMLCWLWMGLQTVTHMSRSIAPMSAKLSPFIMWSLVTFLWCM